MTSVGYFARAWKCDCGSDGMSFDRSLCACGMMHHYCDGCGIQVDPCWENMEIEQYVSESPDHIWREAIAWWTVSGFLGGFLVGLLLGVFG